MGSLVRAHQHHHDPDLHDPALQGYQPGDEWFCPGCNTLWVAVDPHAPIPRRYALYWWSDDYEDQTYPGSECPGCFHAGGDPCEMPPIE